MTQTFPANGVDKQRTQIRHLPKVAPITLAVWTMFSTAVLADESAEKSLPRIEVVGQGAESISRLPGSVSVVTNEAILVNQPLSTQDAIKFVPGVVVREEEGYGFIPNIGMRGLDPNRSQKLLVLEDGVPIAPSLFISNESYYSPRIERMEGIEVLKGAAGLRYGPTTIGGVINYQTKQPENGVRVTAQGGSHGYGLLGLDAGGRTADGKAIGGISMITSQGDGFRNNGFKMEDVVVKGGIAIDERQWLGAKLTYYTNDVNTSYVGLRKMNIATTQLKTQQRAITL
ncbi:MAG: TonB-dependent receptor plug domain-containing protein [Sulfuritalea sp.]|nr:TonB-dependent receptor plug domain-containing protein [Sulfuritalea sp.]